MWMLPVVLVTLVIVLTIKQYVKIYRKTLNPRAGVPRGITAKVLVANACHFNGVLIFSLPKSKITSNLLYPSLTFNYLPGLFIGQQHLQLRGYLA